MSDMDAWKRQAAQQVNAIQPADPEISKAARIRALLPEIEEAMRRGVSQSDIVATLVDTGLVMTLDELRNAIYRARKRQKKGQKIEAIKATAPETAKQATIKHKSAPGDFRQQRDKPLNW